MHDQLVTLVADEGGQRDDHPGVGPQLLFQQRPHQHDLDDAVEEQIDAGEDRGLRIQSVGEMPEPLPDGGVLVSDDEVCGDPGEPGAHRDRVHEEEREPTHQLQDAIDAFEDDADLENAVQDTMSRVHSHRVIVATDSTQGRINSPGLGMGRQEERGQAQLRNLRSR
ncbi:hypothetical protein ABE10_01875 [Bacillus toyonensis]|nr:hypothetical protein [Bacillus toyonensis]